MLLKRHNIEPFDLFDDIVSATRGSKSQAGLKSLLKFHCVGKTSVSQVDWLLPYSYLSHISYHNYFFQTYYVRLRIIPQCTKLNNVKTTL